MKKLFLLGLGFCMVMAFSSCNSKKSAYKTAYDQAKQQELVQGNSQASEPIEIVAPTHFPPALVAPRLAASIIPGPPPVIM